MIVGSPMITSYLELSITKSSCGTANSPIWIGTSRRWTAHFSRAQLATLIRRVVGIIRICNFSTIFRDITFRIAPESSSVSVDSEDTRTRTRRCIDMESPCTWSLSAKVTVARFSRPDNIFWRSASAKSISTLAIWPNVMPAWVWTILLIKSYFSTRLLNAWISAFQVSFREVFLPLFPVFLVQEDQAQNLFEDRSEL